MTSPLSFDSTENFRKKLLVRNLKAYGNGNFTANSNAGTYEFNVDDISVIDSPSVEEVGRVQAKELYKINEFGPEGGFTNFVDINDNQNTVANAGEYDFTASQPPKDTEQSRKDSFIQNVYGPPEGYVDLFSVEDVQRIIGPRDTYYKFVASTYQPSNILFQIDPLGDSGLLSQDSELAQIGAKTLQKYFIDRVALETYEETVARANFLPGNNAAYGPLGVLTGRVPLIEPDWSVSVPATIVGKGLNFISRITGVYSPFSWIPGDYFAPEDKKSALNQAANKLLGVFDKKGTLKLPENKSASDIFLANTGAGNKQSMFRNISFNDYRPDYKGNFIGEINLQAPTGNYYVGSRTSDPIDIISPNNELPQDKDGNKIQTATRGYGELGVLYENNLEFNFGLNSTASYDDGGIQGGFTWVSQQNSPIGLKLGQGGKPIGEDNEYNLIAASFDASKSTNQSEAFRPGSILYDTQNLIDAAERLQGDARLQHVGTAINQVNKVFNDGYQELTKGSRVIRYSQDNGYEVGFEYCRVFTKDVPYYTTGDLQKRTGNIRDFDSSVLSSTYNLNIAPTSGNESTTLDVGNGRVKKYMFSLENLAWRTSNRNGITVDDLPACEKGPNGGRIMWFPPYDLNVGEQVSARWTDTNFLGRPEPVYTYNNTQRTGSLSWKIVVDNPSIMNLIVDRELEKISPDSKVTKIMDSFFAGCLQYDIYELAAKFPQFSLKDIYEIVTTTQNTADYREAKSQIPQENPQTTEQTYQPQLSEFLNLAFYYDHAQPDPGSSSRIASSPFNVYYNNYVALQNTTYATRPVAEQQNPVQNFFNSEIIGSFNNSNNFISRLAKTLKDGATVNVTISASASAPGSTSANQTLSERRVNSVVQYLKTYNLGPNEPTFQSYIDKGQLALNEDPTGEQTQIGDTDCSQNLTPPNDVYSVTAMGCRRAYISKIEEIPPVSEAKPPIPELADDETLNLPTEPAQKKTFTQTNVRPDIAKRVLRKILSECSYFELMKEDSPFVYNSIKEKIKYFQPAFHSITPEGLNSRLTFLQQCMRPGDTIPTVGENGQLIYNDAFNTAFGAPPICILRIGDFYHTKIVIDSIDIRYDPLILDLNPEGIGVQPMIANITMSFKFIGGQGLREPVAQLQNALSFNYYANTEMYDDRADATEEVKEKYNAQVLEAIENIIGFSSSDVRQQSSREGGVTIGTVTSETVIGASTGSTVDGVTGEINYKTFMSEFVDSVKEYAETTLATLEDVNDAYYIGGLRMYTSSLLYQDGQFGLNGSPYSLPTLFGKPENLESKINPIFLNAIGDVDNQSCPLFGDKFSSQNLKNSEQRLFSRTIKDLIVEKQNSYSQFFDTNINTEVQVEQNLIRYIDKCNFVTSESDGSGTGTDGYILAKGAPVIYSLTGTTQVSPASTGAADTLDELIADFTSLGDDIQNFYQNLIDYGIVTDDWESSLDFDFLDNSIDTAAQKRFFMIFGRDIVENKQDFITKVTPDELGQNQKFVDYITSVVNGLQTDYEDSYNASQKLFEDFKTGYFNQTFGPNYGDTFKSKERNFNFSKFNTPNPANLDNIKILYANINFGGNDSYNNKVKLN
jgi:outer membrane protein OmpA-like peptidoglycan-associated protein